MRPALYPNKVALLLILIALSSAAFSQSNREDVLYLKNGSIVRGEIIEQQSGGIIKIELMGGSVFVFQQAEIDSIKKEAAKKKTPNRYYFRKDHGFRNITELGIIYGMGSPSTSSWYNNSDDFGVQLHSVNGYQFWPYLFVGAGVGIDRFASYKETFSPFYVRLASEFLKKRVTPYIFADAGYSVMWGKKDNESIAYRNRGGFYGSAGAGIRIYTASKVSVTLSAAYKQNRSEVTWWYKPQSESDYSYTTKRIYQRLVLAAGVSF